MLFDGPLLACVALSPTAPAVAREAARLARDLGMPLRFLHVGEDEPGVREQLDEALSSVCADPVLELRTGRVDEAVAEAAADCGAGLVVLGALEQEGPLGFLVSSAARRIARSAPCSTLLLPQPRPEPEPFRRVVAVQPAEFSRLMTEDVLELARREDVDVLHLVQEFELPGLHLALDEGADVEDTETVRRVACLMAEHRMANWLEDCGLGDVPVRVTGLQGREGWEAIQYAREHSADLLVVPAPEDAGTVMDRLFPYGTDLTLQTLPCALLVYRETGK